MNGTYKEEAMEVAKAITKAIPTTDANYLYINAMEATFIYLAVIADSLEDICEVLKHGRLN